MKKLKRKYYVGDVICCVIVMINISTDLLNIVLSYAEPKQVTVLLLGIKGIGARRLKYKYNLLEGNSSFEDFHLILLINPKVELDGIYMDYCDVGICCRNPNINIKKITYFNINCWMTIERCPSFEMIAHAKHIVLSKLKGSCENIMYCDKLEILELHDYQCKYVFKKDMFERLNVHTMYVSKTLIMISDINNILRCTKLLKLRFSNCHFNGFGVIKFVHNGLRFVDMCYNILDRSVDFSQCPRLKKMRICCEVSYLWCFILPPFLRYLVLEMNCESKVGVIRIEVFLRECKNLECLRLVSKFGIVWDLKGLEKLEKLRKIDISRSRCVKGYEKIDRKILYDDRYNVYE